MHRDGCSQRDPSEPLHHRGKFSSELAQGACVAPHQLPNHVDGPEDHINELRRHLHAAGPDHAHVVFDVMGEVADGFEADRVGRPFEGVSGPEELLDGVRVLRILLQAEQGRLNGVHIFLGLGRKVGDDFRI